MCKIKRKHKKTERKEKQIAYLILQLRKTERVENYGDTC